MADLMTPHKNQSNMKIISLKLVGYRGFRLRQIKYFEYRPVQKTQVILGTNGSGKAQPLTAPVKIPGGWDTMGNMKLGTEVIAKDGSIAKVTGVFPQERQQIYKVTFADDRSARVTGEHLWKIYQGGREYPIQPKVVTTLALMELLKSKTYGRLLWIDLADSEQNPEIDLPLDPYTLGVILGDGCLSSSVIITHPDEFIMNKVAASLKNGVEANVRVGKKPCLTYCLSSKYEKDGAARLGRGSNYIVNYLRDVGLLYKRSADKFIPKIYFNGSTEQRLSLLQGLMDTDGTISTNGTSSYSTVSAELARGVQHLVHSLGGIASVAVRRPYFTHKGERREGQLAYQINIRYKKPSELFTLPRKKARANDDNQYAATLKLRVVSIEEDGFESAQCISIDHPEHLYITTSFIVTHNSSLMRELSPLPANHTDYEKGGCKEIEIEHRGKHYLLQSLFMEDGNRYPFIVDGENLNPGYTVTVYRELVKEHFNYTLDIHQLLTGVTRFHSMSVNDRRSWFMRISDTDYTYAFKYYQRLKEKVRDLQGALKLNQARLTHETEKCLTEKDEAELRVKVAELTVVLNSLLDHRKPRLSSAEDPFQVLTRIDESLQNDMTRLEALLGSESNYPMFTLTESLESEQMGLQASIQAFEREIVMRCEIIDRYQKELDLSLKTSNVSIEDVTKTITEHQETIATLKRSIRLNLEFEDARSAASAFGSAYPVFEEILTQLSQMPRRDYQRATYQYLLSQKPELDQALLKIRAHETKLFHEKQHLEAHKAKGDVTCPKCEHAWYPNYEEVKYQNVVKEHAEVIAHLNEVEKRAKALEESLAEHQLFFSTLDRLNQHMRVFHQLMPYWNYIKASEKLFSDPESLLITIETLRKDFEYLIALQVNEGRLEAALKLEAMVRDSKHLDHEKHQRVIASETDALTLAQSRCREKQKKLESVKNAMAVQRQINLLYQRTTEALKNREVHYQRLIEDQCVAALDELIRSVRLTLSQYERSLSQIDIQKGVVVALNAQVKEIESELALLKLALKALSPTEGLIAKGMTSFINHFVSQLNNFIANIWLYPLKLLPIKIEDNDSLDLDYKFSVVVNDDPRPSPDVAQTSTGMREVINLAFAAVSMKYLGLTNAPVFLDEFAASLDPAHRQSAYQAIDHLIESTDYSQVFLVSHYQDGYSSLSAADVLVLCDSNVQLPKHLTYNKHVKLS